MTATPTEVPATDARLLPLPQGATIPRLGDWAIEATTPGTAEHKDLLELAAAASAVSHYLLDGAHVGPEAAAELLDRFHRALALVHIDLGPLLVTVTRDQANQVAADSRAAALMGAVVSSLELRPSTIWDLLNDAGHGDHDGWAHDGHAPYIECGCGTYLTLTIPTRRNR